MLQCLDTANVVPIPKDPDQTDQTDQIIQARGMFVQGDLRLQHDQDVRLRDELNGLHLLYLNFI